jgi:hypothetical protein
MGCANKTEESEFVFSLIIKLTDSPTVKYVTTFTYVSLWIKPNVNFYMSKPV